MPADLAASTTAAASSWPRNLLRLAVATGSSGAFMGVQLTLYNNFVVERLHFDARDVGILEAVRESPGLLNALLLALLLRYAPPKTGAVCLIVMGLGMALCARADPFLGGFGPNSFWLFGAASALWSIGFHCWLPLQQAMALAYSPEANRGYWLGRLRSVESGACLAAIATCFATKRFIDYGGLYTLAGVCVLLGAAAVLFAETPASKGPPPARLLLRRRYLRYYVLNILQGCRKQMFITFAIFALVKVHHVPLETIILLAMVNQVLVSLTAKLMGRLVDRHGERITLMASHALLALVFCGYAVIQNRWALYGLYCMDSFLFIGSIAVTTYLDKIADPPDMRASLSMGVTMNHLASVMAPLVGGLVWEAFDYQPIFYAGAVVSLLTVLVDAGIRVPAARPQT